MAIIEGRLNIAKYLYMSPAAFNRQRKKYNIPVFFGNDDTGRRHVIMMADTEKLDEWNEQMKKSAI